MRNAEICREVVDALFAAFAAGDWDEYDRWMYAGVKTCDASPGELLNEMVKTHADEVGKHIAGELVARLLLYVRAGKPNPWKDALTVTNVKYETFFLLLGCDAWVKLIIGVVKALKAQPLWPGPVWPAVSWFLARAEKKCGVVPEEIAEALGEDEYARYASSREDGAGVADYLGQQVIIR
jgi:hypothetical protein